MVPWGKRFLPWSFWPCGTCSSLLCWLLCFITVFRPCPLSHALCQVLPPSPLPLWLPLLSCLHSDLRSELTGAPTGVRDLWEHLVAEFSVLRNPQSGLGVGTEKGLSQWLLRAQASPFSDLCSHSGPLCTGSGSPTLSCWGPRELMLGCFSSSPMSLAQCLLSC